VQFVGQPTGYYKAILHHRTKGGEKVPHTLQQIPMLGGAAGLKERHFDGVAIIPATDSSMGWVQ